jgi:hypothetical protein
MFEALMMDADQGRSAIASVTSECALVASAGHAIPERILPCGDNRVLEWQFACVKKTHAIVFANAIKLPA